MFKALSWKLNIDQNRIYGLDLLRALAVFIVVITHSETYCPKGVTGVIEAVYLDAVTMFFVLSGFLIGRLLIKTLHGVKQEEATLVNFWWRRWTRTLPLYFFVLCLLILGHNFPDFKAPSYKRFFFFSQNLVTPHPGFFIEAWSLSVEEWFYVLIPLFCFISVKYLKASIKRSILVVSGIVILFSTLMRLLRYFENVPIDNMKFELLVRMQVVTRLDSLMYGVLGALLSYFRPAAWAAKKELKLLLGILILAANKVLDDLHPGGAFIFYHTVFYLSMNSIGTLLMLPYLSTYKTAKGAFPKVVTYLSVISYSVYLVNLTPIHEYIMPFINRHILSGRFSPGAIVNINLALFFPMTFILSIYLYKFIERPFINIRDRINFGLPAKKQVVKTY